MVHHCPRKGRIAAGVACITGVAGGRDMSCRFALCRCRLPAVASAASAGRNRRMIARTEESRKVRMASVAFGSGRHMAAGFCQSTLRSLRSICTIVASRANKRADRSVIHHCSRKGNVTIGVASVTSISGGRDMARRFALSVRGLPTMTGAASAGGDTGMVIYRAQESCETLVASVAIRSGRHMAAGFCQSAQHTLRGISTIVASRAASRADSSVIHDCPRKGGIAARVASIAGVARGRDMA